MFVILLVKLSQLYSLYVLLVLTLQYQNKLTDAKENVDTKKDLLTTFSSIYFTSRISEQAYNINCLPPVS